MSNTNHGLPDELLHPEVSKRFDAPVFIGAVFRFKDDDAEYAYLGMGWALKINGGAASVPMLGTPRLPHRFVTKQEWETLPGWGMRPYPNRAARAAATGSHSYPLGSVFGLNYKARYTYVELPALMQNGDEPWFYPADLDGEGTPHAPLSVTSYNRNVTTADDAPPHRVVTDSERMAFVPLLPTDIIVTSTGYCSVAGLAPGDVLTHCEFKLRDSQRPDSGILVGGFWKSRRIVLNGGLEGGDGGGGGSRWRPRTPPCTVIDFVEPVDMAKGASAPLAWPNGRPAAPAPEGLCDGPTPPPAPPSDRPVPSRPGWRAEWDSRLNRWYFVNKRTNETVWEIPAPREPSKEEMFDFLLTHESNGNERRTALDPKRIKESMLQRGLL